jgi:hypothetical protein
MLMILNEQQAHDTKRGLKTLQDRHEGGFAWSASAGTVPT